MHQATLGLEAVLVVITSPVVRRSAARAVAPDVSTEDPSGMVEVLFQQLQASPCPAAPVLDGDKLVGILTVDTIGRVLRLRSALHAQAAHVPVGAGR